MRVLALIRFCVSLAAISVSSATHAATAAETSKTNSTSTDATSTELSNTDKLTADSPKPDSSKTDSPKSDAAKADSSKADSSKSDAPKADSSKADSSKSDAAKSEMAKTDTDKTLHEQITDLEKDAFSHAYEANTDEQRVIRLEHFVFGKQASGELTNRLKRLRKAIAPKEANHFTASVPSVQNVYENPNAAFPTFLHPEAPSTTPESAQNKPLSVIDLMNRGIDNYNRHRYSNADDDFEECCARAPGMSRCYAYLAITKLQLNLRQAAFDAFRMSTIVDPFGPYGRYSRSCMIVLAGDEAMRKRPPIDSKQVLDSALTNIDKQSSELVSRHRSAADQIANARMNYRNQFSMVDARLESNSARTEGALRAAHAAESANNLKHILAVKKMPGDANLRAWGTTLTARYYGNETYLNAPYYIPKERPMELKAIVQSLNSSHKPHAKAAQGHAKHSSKSSDSAHSALAHTSHSNHSTRKHYK